MSCLRVRVCVRFRVRLRVRVRVKFRVGNTFRVIIATSDPFQTTPLDGLLDVN